MKGRQAGYGRTSKVKCACKRAQHHPQRARAALPVGLEGLTQKPHFHRRSGFFTSQFGSGMHKMHCHKDHNGNVRV
eukprot:557773-Pleurochrysis_carterae.AAC.7